VGQEVRDREEVRASEEVCTGEEVGREEVVVGEEGEREEVEREVRDSRAQVRVGGLLAEDDAARSAWLRAASRFCEVSGRSGLPVRRRERSGPAAHRRTQAVPPGAPRGPAVPRLGRSAGTPELRALAERGVLLGCQGP